MPGHKSLLQILQLIARLKRSRGVDKHKFAGEFETTVRTIERHLEVLRDVGFEIVKNEAGRYSLGEASESPFDTEDHLSFTIQEAEVIRDALLNNPEDHKLRNSILQKLYALSEMDDVAGEIQKGQHSRNIAALSSAIHNKFCAYLNGYQSSSSGTIKNRYVEPIRFLRHFRYLLAYEPAVAEMRQYKLERVGSVTTVNIPWKHEDQHRLQTPDTFYMHGTEEIAVEMTFTQRARNLLCEEFPAAEKNIPKEGDHYHYSDTVHNLEGVGRFVAGLPEEITLPPNSPLLPFLKEKWKNFSERHYLS